MLICFLAYCCLAYLSRCCCRCLQNKRSELIVALEMAEQRQDLARIADIKYGSLLEVDETLKKLRTTGPKAGEAMLVEEVGPEEIATVVSKWTGKDSECIRWCTPH